MDLADQLGFGEVLVRLAAATAIGSVLGIERRLHDKPAGMRTHAMVALGSALFALIGLHLERQGGGGEQSLSRVVQGVVAGIGFLGGGAIMKEGVSVHGLTTAASIWIVAGLGLACGAGYWRLGLIALGLALIVFMLGGQLEYFVSNRIKSASGRSKFVKWLLSEQPPARPTDGP